MPNTAVSGTFTTTGQSSEVQMGDANTRRYGALELAFASTGSVTLQRRTDGTNWRTATDQAGNACTFTANVNCNVEFVAGASYRLNCTDATGNVTYFLGMPRG